MAIQFERKPLDQPFRPPRKGDNPIHKFWAPKANFFSSKQIETKQKETKHMINNKPKAKTPQPSKKVVSFWESKSTSHQQQSSLITTNSKSMSSLNIQHEVDEKRGYAPSDVAKDPMKREFLTNLSKKIFSPPDGLPIQSVNNNTRKLSRHNQMSRSFRVWVQNLDTLSSPS